MTWKIRFTPEICLRETKNNCTRFPEVPDEQGKRVRFWGGLVNLTLYMISNCKLLIEMNNGSDFQKRESRFRRSEPVFPDFRSTCSGARAGCPAQIDPVPIHVSQCSGGK